VDLERITALARAVDVEVLFLMQGQNERVCGVGSVVGSEVEKCSLIVRVLKLQSVTARDVDVLSRDVVAVDEECDGC
jgi:hypothetical protein